MSTSKEKILGLATSLIFAYLSFALVWNPFSPFRLYLGRYAPEIVLTFWFVIFSIWFFIKPSSFAKYLILGIVIAFGLRLVLVYLS